MRSDDEIRDEVSRAYARAVSEPVSRGCCGGAPEQVECGPTMKGVAAKVAGYAPDELAALPEEAVSNAFGCGNPVAFSALRPGDVVVDLGSGAGIDLLLAAARVGPTGRVIGVDMTDEMIVRARRSIEASGLANVEVRKGIIEELPVESDSVDWVISNCVINLSPDKPRVFAEIARVLRAGGGMQVSDIVVESLPDWMRQSPALYNSCIAGAVSEAEYLDGLRRAGLVAVEVLDRQVYDTGQLAALIRSELPEAGLDDARVGELAAAVEGKIWSARFAARKPA